MYDLSNPEELVKVAELKDIEDDGQTVVVKEKPEVPQEPEKPTPSSSTPSTLPQTGDSTNLQIASLGLGLSLVTLGILYYRHKKEQTKSE